MKPSRNARGGRTPWMLALGERIRSAREQRGLTQRQLADRAELTADVISRLENGHFLNPGLRTLRRLAAGLGIAVSELLPDDRPPPRADATRLRIDHMLDDASDEQRELVARLIAAVLA